MLHRLGAPFFLGDLLNVLKITCCIFAKGNGFATLFDATCMLRWVEFAKEGFAARRRRIMFCFRNAIAGLILLVYVLGRSTSRFHCADGKSVVDSPNE